MSTTPNPRLRRVFLDIVENQLREDKPPETRRTLERLLKQGISRKQAIEMIACAVSSEIFAIMKHGQPFDEARYVASLQALPRMPWETDDSA